MWMFRVNHSLTELLPHATVQLKGGMEMKNSLHSHTRN